MFGSAPASGVTVVIIRTAFTQGLDPVANDPFPAVEEALDKLTFMSQKHEEELVAIKASRTNTLTGSEFTISYDRANKVFAFDTLKSYCNARIRNF